LGWAYVVVSTVGVMGVRVLVFRRNPDTMAERARGLKPEGTAPWDRWLVPFVIWSPIVALLVAGLDVRYGWSSMTGIPVRIGALALMAAAYAFAGWAMLENRFFVAGVRLQEERGHTVVRTGPYRFVRHPGYAASLVSTSLVPVILDSAWAFIPAGIGVAALVVRTALEDRFLHRGLDGYTEYAGATRYRLLPGIW
jgi:protein-S-isoprenylcysteine O-methyltransferase Ste14